MLEERCRRQPVDFVVTTYAAIPRCPSYDALDLSATAGAPSRGRDGAPRRALEPPHGPGVTFAGPDLEGLTVEHPAASVRLLLPKRPTHDIVLPMILLARPVREKFAAGRVGIDASY